jgi:hypothetical protein
VRLSRPARLDTRPENSVGDGGEHSQECWERGTGEGEGTRASARANGGSVSRVIRVSCNCYVLRRGRHL